MSTVGALHCFLPQACAPDETVRASSTRRSPGHCCTQRRGMDHVSFAATVQSEVAAAFSSRRLGRQARFDHGRPCCAACRLTRVPW